MSLWGKTDADASVPKYLNEEQRAKAIFIDNTEAADADTKAKGITGPGWWLYEQYKNAAGAIRHKAECLIPMKVTAVAAGDRANDAGIDTAGTYDITLTTKPVARSVASGAATTFAVVAAITSGGGALSYQWQRSTTTNGNVYVDITNTGVYTGATTATLAISNVTTPTNLNGFKYRVIVSATNAVSETSPAVKLTVA